MCPVCIASAAMIAASGASTGGLSALIIRSLVRIANPKKFPKLESKEKSRHEYEHHRTSKSGIASEMGSSPQGAMDQKKSN